MVTHLGSIKDALIELDDQRMRLTLRFPCLHCAYTKCESKNSTTIRTTLLIENVGAPDWIRTSGLKIRSLDKHVSTDVQSASHRGEWPLSFDQEIA